MRVVRTVRSAQYFVPRERGRDHRPVVLSAGTEIECRRPVTLGSSVAVIPRAVTVRA
jgi:hypothetical protein